MRLISEKWDHPSISMTGGMDSKTTLACANGLYDQFRYYSYISMYGDKPDADAAAKLQMPSVSNTKPMSFRRTMKILPTFPLYAPFWSIISATSALSMIMMFANACIFSIPAQFHLK